MKLSEIAKQLSEFTGINKEDSLNHLEQLLEWANSGVDELPFVLSALRAVENRAELETLYANNQHLSSVPEFIDVLKEMGLKYPKIEE